MTDTAAIILAAGKGTRMKSGLVKVMHKLDGEPMVAYPLRSARAAEAKRIAVVLGHQGEKVREFLASDSDVQFFLQEEQLGTGHAVACASAFLEETDGDVFILCGDVPLIEAATLQALHAAHRQEKAAVTVLTAVMVNPFGYGRIVKNMSGRVEKIVEEKDASAEEKKITEINAGIYCVEARFLREAIKNLSNDNAQGEYYLTEIVDRAVAQGLTCISTTVAEPDEVMGINDRVQLSEAARFLRRRTNRRLMLDGVTIIDPEATYISTDVAIGPDTVIHPNVHLQGKTVIGKDCVIEPSVIIADCTIGDGCHIKAGSVLHDSVVGNEVAIGPMAHLRPGSVLRDHVKIGNFVETKKIVMGEGSKASHLTYLGDAEIGRDVNIGCGTITCNYDGVRKHKTVIEDGVFVGSDVQLVAPVKVGARSLIAAGTTVTKDVPEDSLAISRVPQVNKDGYMKRQAKG